MVTRIKFLVVLILGFLSANGQDPHFSQFYANPIYLNPAFAGSQICPRIVFNYRNQWPSLTGTYVTYAASFDQYFQAVGGGLGISAFHDRAGEGTLNTTNINAMYAYNKPVNRYFSMSAALQVTYFQKAIDWNRLTFGDMIDARYGFIYSTQETPILNSKNGVDFSSGILVYSQKFYGGFAVHHLFEPDEALMGASKLPRRYTFHGGVAIPIDDKKSTISPGVLFMQQGNFQQLNLGFTSTKGSISGGLWYRNRDALIIQTSVQIEQLKVGYSYDITLSKLGVNNTMGAHELSVQLNIRCPKKGVKFKIIECPIWN